MSKFCEIQISNNQTILAVVGDIDPQKNGVIYKVFDVLKQIPIKMISYGASHRSICLVIDSENKIKALNLLNNLF